MPVETEFGRKRAIDQSSCNKDYSCVNGFCPSFATVEGGKLRKPRAVTDAAGPRSVTPDAAARQWSGARLPSPTLPPLDRPYGILVTGVGGTGVVTIGAILGMAAHLEGKGVAVLDMTGLAQKGGSVYSHIRIAREAEEIHAVRIAAGEASLVIGADMIVSATDEAIAKMQVGRTRAVINGNVAPLGGFTRNPDMQVPTSDLAATIREAVGTDNAHFVDATQLATALLGDSIATNLFMVGYAFQKGLIPLREASILRAIELNGAAVESNQRAFEWGRRAVVDIAAVAKAATPAEAKQDSLRLSESLDETIARRVTFLTDYQDSAYAASYVDFVKKVREAEAAGVPGSTRLTAAVARYLFKLMAYKDEYEVARLHTDTGFLDRVAAQFEGEYKVNLHLAPPLWAKVDARTGEARKRSYGPWMFGAMKLLARFKGLRGTAFDIFGYSEERRTERRLIEDYRKTVEVLLRPLDAARLDLAVEIASIPEQIRGYGHVKRRHLVPAKAREAELVARWHSPDATVPRGKIPIKVAA